MFSRFQFSHFLSFNSHTPNSLSLSPSRWPSAYFPARTQFCCQCSRFLRILCISSMQLFSINLPSLFQLSVDPFNFIPIQQLMNSVTNLCNGIADNHNVVIGMQARGEMTSTKAAAAADTVETVE